MMVDVDQDELLDHAREIISLRQRRSDLLPPELFGEPGWNILLVLFVAHLERRRLSIGEACAAAGVVKSIAVRWLAILGDRRLVERQAMPGDSGEWIVLHPIGLEKMSQVLSKRM